MTGPEIKQQIEQAADSFKDDKIDQTEAKKIADTLDTNKVKSEDVQDFIEHSPTYSSVIDWLITNIEKYTKPDAFIWPILPGEKKLQIVENKVPLQSLTQTEKEKIISDATKFLIRMKEEKANFDKKKNSLPVTPPVKEIINTTPASAEVKYDSQKPLESMLLAINDNLIQAKV